MESSIGYFSSTPSCSCEGMECLCGFIYLYKQKDNANTNTEGQREED